MMRGDFQNEEKFIYVLLTHPLFRQSIYVRYPDSQKNTFFAKYTPSFGFRFLQSFEFTNVLPT